ncbi:histone deacetylase [Streptomyces erythrochromogenes]|uniref:histone deacetylase n=1 Tax=Streptomyces erythrochromogenes TaxID=285574 RepID=UPI00381B2F9F|nr:histone deacetylase [Streptomyces erythrochromogenes]
MAVHAVRPLTRAVPAPEQVWYASYGSNMHMDRLTAYIAGGAPPGATHAHPGCRDRRAPERSVPVELDGRLYFATESLVWTGGRGYYDPTAPGRLRGRAHLVTTGQLSDIAAQEMGREPGADLDLSTVLRDGRHTLGPGRYETLVCPGTIDSIPVVTFTAPWTLRDVELRTPAAGYLRHLASGLLASGPWTRQDTAEYLSTCPGAAGTWTPDCIHALLTTTTTSQASAPGVSGPRGARSGGWARRGW